MSRVIVFGSINMDVVARVPHIPRPGETLSGSDLSYFPGGKGSNQAIASAQAGAPTHMVGALGNDTFAETLSTFLESKNVDTENIASIANTPTGTALINVDDAGENCIVIIPGANAHVSASALGKVSISPDDIVVAQLEVPMNEIATAFQHARTSGAQTILNPAPMTEIHADILSNTSIMILNEIELSMLSGIDISDTSHDEEIISAVEKIPSEFSGECIVTLGSRGCLSYNTTTQQQYRHNAYSVAAVDTTGAGDCFVGVLAATLTTTSDLDTALSHAVAASSICVERNGAGPSMPTAQEIDLRLSEINA